MKKYPGIGLELNYADNPFKSVSALGWFYEKAEETENMYKEQKYVLEHVRIRKRIDGPSTELMSFE